VKQEVKHQDPIPLPKADKLTAQIQKSGEIDKTEKRAVEVLPLASPTTEDISKQHISDIAPIYTGMNDSIPLTYNFARVPFPNQDGFKLLIGVVSAPNHEDARNSIRKTWAKISDNLGKKIDVRFFVGQISDEVKNKAELEILLNNSNDVIRLNTFVENYYNLTKKAKAIFSWANANGYSALMKVDDDTYVNIDNLWEFILHNSDIIEVIYAGHINKVEYGECRVHRNPQSKWYMIDQYPYNDFPDFADGPGMLLGSHALQFLAQNSDNLFEFRCDDAAVGIWTESLNLIKVDMKTSIYDNRCSNSDVFINPVSALEMFTLSYSKSLCGSGYVLEVCLDQPCLCKGHPDRNSCWQAIIDEPYQDIIPRL